MEKDGKTIEMKRFFPFVLFPLFLFGASFSTHINFSGEPAVALKTAQSAFNTFGYRLEVSDFDTQNQTGEFEATAIGNKVLNPEMVKESFKEQGIEIEAMNTQQQTLSMMIDAQKALWNLPLLVSDEGIELKRVHSPQWYRVEEAQSIRIEPPYSSEWYPDIAVFDRSLNLLYSYRSDSVKEGFELELPSGSVYLKVSNVQGMKVLREGMWIESKSLGRP